jgi:hypothetical protein
VSITDGEVYPAIWYRGYYQVGCAGVIEAVAADGSTVGVVAHLPKHSTGGMSWGYLGSGPTDAARSLLIAAIGQAAICPLCKGGGADPATGCLCDLGYRVLPYHAFKDEVMARLPEVWSLARADVIWWLLKNTPGAHDWLTGPMPTFPAERPQVPGPRRPAEEEQ